MSAVIGGDVGMEVDFSDRGAKEEDEYYCGCRTPERAGIPRKLTPPPPARKKPLLLSPRNRASPPENGKYFIAPDDLEQIFVRIPQAYYCA